MVAYAMLITYQSKVFIFCTRIFYSWLTKKNILDCQFDIWAKGEGLTTLTFLMEDILDTIFALRCVDHNKAFVFQA